MTVLLVLGRKAMSTVAVDWHEKAVPAFFGGDYVGGFLVPGHVGYHPGHSWLVRERKNLVRVGADEFAAALAGKLEKIELACKPSTWVFPWMRTGASIIPRRFSNAWSALRTTTRRCWGSRLAICTCRC
jgi:hypothetical protein